MPVLFGAKWGLSQANGTPGGVVTWSIGRAGLSGVQNTYGTTLSDITADGQTLASGYDVEVEFRRAFAAWSAVSDIDFVQIADDGSEVGVGLGADIRVFFGQIDGSSGGTLAVAFFPFSQSDPRAGDILFDIAETEFYASRSNFRAVAIHEIGHTIGLDHITSVTAIMNPFVGAISELQDDDIEGATTIYGQATAAPASISVGASPDLTILSGPDGIQLVGDARGNAIAGAGGRETLLGMAGNDDLRGGGGADAIRGGGGADTISGDGAGDLLLGQGGGDRIEGGGGRDEIVGGGGDDILSGGGGADTIRGLAGDDVIAGDRGVDLLAGGGGADRFAFAARGGADRVTDFAPGLDFLDYSGHSGVSGLADLVISDGPGGATISDGAGGRVTLAGVAAAELTEADFLF